jgi:hypothetical protein
MLAPQPHNIAPWWLGHHRRTRLFHKTIEGREDSTAKGLV